MLLARFLNRDSEPPASTRAAERRALASRWPEADEWPADESGSDPARDVASVGPAQRGAVRRHREVLAICGVVAVMAFVLVEVPGGRVAVRGLTDYPLPQSCATRSLLGMKCPGCGLTRSIIHLAAGDWRASWQSHRLGGLLAAVLLLQVPYRVLSLCRPGSPLIPPRWQTALGLALVALLVVNWLADVVAGRLAPL